MQQFHSIFMVSFYLANQNNLLPPLSRTVIVSVLIVGISPHLQVSLNEYGPEGNNV